MIGAGLGQIFVADRPRRFDDLGVERRILGIGGAHDVARDVAAGGDGVEQGFVEALDRGPNVLLQHPVELEGLAGGEPKLLAAMGPGERVELQPLLGRAHSARQPHPDHEAIGRLQLLAPPFVAQVAVVLLVHSVDLHQPRVVGGDGAGDAVEEPGGDGSAQIVAGFLQRLVRAQPVERLREVLAPVDQGFGIGHVSRRPSGSVGCAEARGHIPRRPRAAGGPLRRRSRSGSRGRRAPSGPRRRTDRDGRRPRAKRRDRRRARPFAAGRSIGRPGRARRRRPSGRARRP